jgi:hypothetical protein
VSVGKIFGDAFGSDGGSGQALVEQCDFWLADGRKFLAVMSLHPMPQLERVLRAIIAGLRKVFVISMYAPQRLFWPDVTIWKQQQSCLFYFLAVTKDIFCVEP